MKKTGVSGEGYVPTLNEIWDFLVGFKEATEAGFERLGRDVSALKYDVGIIKSEIADMRSDIADIHSNIVRIDRRLVLLDDRISVLEAWTAARS